MGDLDPEALAKAILFGLPVGYLIYIILFGDPTVDSEE